MIMQIFMKKYWQRIVIKSYEKANKAVHLLCISFLSISFLSLFKNNFFSPFRPFYNFPSITLEEKCSIENLYRIIIIKNIKLDLIKILCAE